MSQKLEKLLINEVSGVDDPANEIPGWMVAKSSDFRSSLPIGPDEQWDVGAAEKRVREACDATDGPNKKYAGCYLWYDGSAADDDGDGVPDRFGDYKFLVVDAVDGKLSIMPGALRAAASRLPNSGIPAADKDSIGAVLDKLESKAGIGDASKASGEDDSSILSRIKKILGGKEDIDMTKDEVTAVIDERLEAFGDKLAERLSKSVEAPGEEVATDASATKEATETATAKAAVEAPAVAPATPEVPATEETPAAITEEFVVKAIETAMAPVLEILDATLNRIEGTEKALTVRKSLDGQETPSVEGEAKSPTLGDAIVKAFGRTA